MFSVFKILETFFDDGWTGRWVDGWVEGHTCVFAVSLVANTDGVNSQWTN